jgi:hypothetical protein
MLWRTVWPENDLQILIWRLLELNRLPFLEVSKKSNSDHVLIQIDIAELKPAIAIRSFLGYQTPAKNIATNEHIKRRLATLGVANLTGNVTRSTTFRLSLCRYWPRNKGTQHDNCRHTKC